MKTPFHKQNAVLCFRRWSRKSWAVFTSLTAQVRIGILSLGCSLLALSGHSKETLEIIPSQPPLQVEELEEVVVSAQMSPVLQSELMRVVQLITRAQIEQSPSADLPALLGGVRGVDVRQRGVFGMQADVGIRGGTFDQSMVLLNGINLTDPQTGHHNLAIPVGTQVIERIEILQGPGARLWGPNAFTGAINIITSMPQTPRITLGIEGGQYGYGSAAVTLNMLTGKYAHLISVKGSRSDGFVDNTDFSALDLYYRGLFPTGSYTVDAQLALGQKAFGANSFYTPVFPDQFEEIQSVLLSFKGIPHGRLKIEPRIYWRRLYDRFELFRHDAPQWYAGHNYHQTDIVGAGLGWNRLWRWGKSSLAAEYRYEHIYSTVLGDEVNVPVKAWQYSDVFYTHSYARNGLSLMAEHNLYAGNFSFSAGSLLWLHSDLDHGAGFFPGVDAGWQFHPHWRGYASVSRTLRLPTFTDLFYASPTHLGNRHLQPEKAIAAETGLKLDYGSLHADFVIFRRWGKDMIDWIKAPGDEFSQSMNFTQINYSGLETGFYLNLHPWIPQLKSNSQLSLHYTYMHADKSHGDFVSYYVLDYVNHKLDASVRMPFSDKWGMSCSVSWVDRAGGYMVFENNEYTRNQPFSAYWQVDARMYYQFTHLEAYVSASNLWNETTVNVANVPYPGRWIRAGLKADLQL